MNWIDVAGVIGLIGIIGVYIVVSPMLEGKKGKGKGRYSFGVLDGISKRIKEAVRWVNRQ